MRHLYRSRGDGFDLRPVYAPWSDQKLKIALQGDPHGVSIYAVDPKDGEGFARGACHGATKAWLAMVPPKAYQPLVIAVLGDDPAKHAPVICETLEYRGRANGPCRPGATTRRGSKTAPRSGSRSSDHSSSPGLSRYFLSVPSAPLCGLELDGRDKARP